MFFFSKTFDLKKNYILKITLGQTFLWTVINFHINMRMFLSWNNNTAANMRKRVRVFAKPSQQRTMSYTLTSLHQVFKTKILIVLNTNFFALFLYQIIKLSLTYF